MSTGPRAIVIIRDRKGATGGLAPLQGVRRLFEIKGVNAGFVLIPAFGLVTNMDGVASINCAIRAGPNGQITTVHAWFFCIRT